MSCTLHILQWVPEIAHHCPKTPFLLVGTMIDLRDDAATLEIQSKGKQSSITIEEAEELAREIKAVKYVECSALTQKGLKDVFDEAILAALKPLELEPESEPVEKRGWLRMPLPNVPLPNVFRSLSESNCFTVHLNHARGTHYIYIVCWP